jgi:hypothetical protein
MKAVFYAWGDVFKNNLEISEFSNVNIYPLVAEILGLKVSKLLTVHRKRQKGFEIDFI